MTGEDDDGDDDDEHHAAEHFGASKKCLVRMSNCMEDVNGALQKLTVLLGREESMDTSFTLASFILAYLRNLSSAAVFITPRANDPAFISACLQTISNAVQQLKIHRGSDDEFEDALRTLQLTASPCHSVLREALGVIRAEYRRVRAFFSRRVREGDLSARGARNALGAVESFMLRSVDPMLCASFASLRLLVLLAGDARAHATSPPRCEECSYLVIQCMQTRRIFNAMHPLHQRNILRCAILLAR